MEIYFKELPDYGDHMTFASFKSLVDCGAFIDYDGHGKLATEDKASNVLVYPSNLSDPEVEIPDWATHVVWFNK